MGMVFHDCITQESTTTGAGDLTLGAAQTGFVRFQDRCTNLDTFVYEAHAVDAGGVRTGAWEVGVGQYWLDGATPKLRRLWKLSGSNQPAAEFVSFAAGTKLVSLTASASQVRDNLRVGIGQSGSPVTLYVRSDGANNNSGLADTAAHAFLTLAQAMNVAAEYYKGATVMVGAGTFSAASTAGTFMPCNMSIIGAGVGVTTLGTVVAQAGEEITVSECTLASASDVGLSATGFGAVIIAYNVDFSSCAAGHVSAADGGSVSLGAYTISGGCSAGPHIAAGSFGKVLPYDEITVSANVTFSGGFVQCAHGPAYVDMSGASFVLGSNTVTGKRYDINANSVCDTAGGGASFLPGTIAGTVASGGQYL